MFFGKKKKKEESVKGQTQTEQKKENASSFVGFVLLSDESWDKARLRRDLQADWGLNAARDSDEIEENLVFPAGNMMAVVALMEAPVPDGEAEQNAANNYMWPGAVEAAKAHKAHLMVAVMGTEPDPLERGKLFVKLLAACCKQKNALGVYTSGTVFEPSFYLECAEMTRRDMLPILNWIWFGLYRREGGVCCYTYGMEVFGRDEMEVLDAQAQPSDVRNFLLDLVSYVLESGVTLKDGETIGFSAEDKHAITRGEGVSLPGMTLKITY